MRAKAAWLALLCLALLLAAGPAQAEVKVRVLCINDGDTITVMLKGRPERVRLIGVDAPEMVHSQGLARRARRHGRTAKQVTALGAASRGAVLSVLAPDDEVRLVWGPQRRDDHRRLLAYVYLADGRLLNRWLIEEGWARAYHRFEHKYKQEFLRLENEARRARRGLWAQGGP
ncbi:MAG: thermonuclease family protein [Thermodesulfobacteriota bacterium]